MSANSKPQTEHLTREVAEFICDTPFAGAAGRTWWRWARSRFSTAWAWRCRAGPRTAADWCGSISPICNLGAGPATVIGTNLKIAPRFAAFANGVGIHADDYDDTQLAVAADRVYGLLTHPTAPALPAALAMAEATDASGPRPMLAYHLGVEVECKIAEAINPRHYQAGFHTTATCGTFARGGGQRQAARPRRGSDGARAVDRRQPVGRPARELRHDDQAVPRRTRVGERRRRGAVRLLWLDRHRPHPGSAARLLQRGRRRLRSGGDRRQARRAVDASPTRAFRSSRIRRARSRIPA